MQKMNKVLYLLLILTSLTSCINLDSKPICETKPDNYNYGYKDRYGYIIYHNLEQAKVCSENTGRPILLMFAGWRNVSDRHSIWGIFEDKNIKNIIEDNYLFTMLYVDDKTRLKSIDSTKMLYTGKIIETIGELNLNLQINQFQVNAHPFYAIVDSKMNIIVEPIGYVPIKNKNQFIDFLKKGINK